MNTTLTILLFGQLIDHVGGQRIDLPLVKDSDELKQRLFEIYPALEQTKFVVSVDRKIVHSNTKIAQGAEVALLPPFSGG